MSWKSGALCRYLSQLPAEPVGCTPIFRNRTGRPYSKNKLSADFRAVRSALFGKQEK